METTIGKTTYTWNFMKEYDYILANILNPGFSNQDFKDILGMNMENTQILPYSQF